MSESLLRQQATTSRSSLAPLAAIVVLWAVVQAFFIKAGIVPLMAGDLIDSDAYLQLVNVAHIASGGGWYDGLLARSNWPFGEPATWSHALDIVLLAMTALLRPFLGFDRALFWAGVLVSPLLGLAAAFAARWMAKPLLGPKAWAAAILLLLQPTFLSYTDARGPNHHGLLFIAFIVAFGFMLRVLTDPRDRRWSIGAGLALAAGIWISLELIMALVLALAVLGLLWLVKGERWAVANRGLAIGFALGLLILLPIERAPFSGFMVTAYDRLSIVHVFLAVLLLAFWMIVPAMAQRWIVGIGSRAVLAGLGIAIACGAMMALFPKFFAGPLAEANPEFIPLIITGNSDWQPTLPTSLAGAGRFFLYVGSALFTVPWALHMLWGQRRGPDNAAWLFIAINLLFFTAMTLWALRFSPLAEMSGVVVLANLIDSLQRRIDAQALWAVAVRSIAIAILLVGPVFTGMFLLSASVSNAATTASGACRIAAIAPLLDDPAGLGARQHVIAAGIHSGPEILYRTSHAVLATPMIRNPGIGADFHLMSAGDDAAAKTIVDDRQVDLILLCPTSGERHVFRSDAGQNTFYNRLLLGQLPGWLQPVPLSKDLTGHFYLFSVKGKVP